MKKLILKFTGTFDKPINTGNKKDILIVGKSNCGKSSLINNCFHTKLARISKKPGKTQNLNYYELCGTPFNLVDTYGYSYAKLSHDKKIESSLVMDNYFKEVRHLYLVIFVLNGHNFWSTDDKLMLEFLIHNQQAENKNYKILTVINKIDKLNQSERHKIETIVNSSNIKQNPYLYHSTRDENNNKALFDKICELTDHKI